MSEFVDKNWIPRPLSWFRARGIRPHAVDGITGRELRRMQEGQANEQRTDDEEHEDD